MTAITIQGFTMYNFRAACRDFIKILAPFPADDNKTSALLRFGLCPIVYIIQ